LRLLKRLKKQSVLQNASTITKLTNQNKLKKIGSYSTDEVKEALHKSKSISLLIGMLPGG
jgi:hypothetical protein